MENLSEEDLCKLGRFNVRMIAEGLGLLDTKEDRYAFLGMDIRTQVHRLKESIGPSLLVREILEACQEQKRREETLRVILASIQFSRKRR